MDHQLYLPKAYPKAKVLMLCNPSNPTGGVHSTELLTQIAQVLEKYPNVVILADEIYERLVYTDDGQCTSFASLPGMFPRTITLNGFSKSHAMTGFRLGYLAAPERFAKATATLQGQITSCASSVSQAAGVAALNEVDESWLTNNVEIMKETIEQSNKEIHANRAEIRKLMEKPTEPSLLSTMEGNMEKLSEHVKTEVADLREKYDAMKARSE